MAAPRPLQGMDGPATMTARQASERLTRALTTAASQGLRPHCSDAGTSELWLSEHEPERAEAVKLSLGCPVILPCGQAAEERDERWHVWGGVDMTRRPGRGRVRHLDRAPDYESGGRRVPVRPGASRSLVMSLVIVSRELV